MTTVWIYVDTNKEVGDVDHLKVFATPELADEWLKENDPKALLLDMRSSIDIKALGRVFWTLGISAQKLLRALCNVYGVSSFRGGPEMSR
jgi:hypothetical protein